MGRSALILLSSVCMLAALSGAASAAPLARPTKDAVVRYPRGSICVYEVFDFPPKEPVPETEKPLERTAEVEIDFSLVLPHLTTDDGTLAPLVKPVPPLPPRQPRWYHRMFGIQPPTPEPQPTRWPKWFTEMFGLREPSEVQWDDLTSEQKLIVLNASTEKHNYFRTRRISGLKIKDGTHPLAEFQKYVEFLGPSDAGNVTGLELHLRLAKPASVVARAARAASKSLGRLKQHLHVHIPMRIRWSALKARPVIEAIKHMDYVRRTELLSQMLTVMETAVDLSENKSADGTLINFQIMPEPDELSEVAIEFLLLRMGSVLTLKEKFSVGYRGEGFYDVPELWGIEVRSINRSFSDDTAGALLDAIELSGQLENFGYDSDRIRPWLRTVYVNPADLDPSPEIYNPVAETLYPTYNKPLGWIECPDCSSEDQLLWKTVQAKLKSTAASPTEVKMRTSNLLRMIMHGWEKDVLFYDSPSARARISMARKNAMRKILRDEPLQLVTREFLLNSGIFQTLGASLRFEITVLTP